MGVLYKEKPMKKIDCLGDMCPVPVMKLQRETRKMKPGERVLLITDHSCTVKSVREFCAGMQMACVCDEVMNGVWETTVSR